MTGPVQPILEGRCRNGVYASIPRFDEFRDAYQFGVGGGRHIMHDEAAAHLLYLGEGGGGGDAVAAQLVRHLAVTGEFARVVHGGYFRRRSMATFLEQVAQAVLAEHGTSLANVAVVLPSQRAGLHLRHALAAKAGSALWSPQLFTLSGLMERMSGMRVLPMEELLFEAYEAYRSVAGNDTGGFDEFMQWAPVTLADISEADAHMLPLQGFYRDLRSWEDLEWSFNSDPLSEGQQRMVRYWARTGQLHLALNERLLAQNAGTVGLVERCAAEKAAGPWPWERLWFVGLNAFTRTEARVLHEAQAAGIARFAWDVDAYYLDDLAQEAGEHLRKAMHTFGKGVIPVTDRLRSGGLKMRVVETATSISQAWCASTVIAGLSMDERAQTVVVLADEGLLPAVLEALPADTGPLNITMGLALASLPVGSLVEALLRLRPLMRAPEDATPWAYRTADLEHLLLHPYLYHGASAGAIDQLLHAVHGDRAAAIPLTRLRTALGGVDASLGGRMVMALGLGADSSVHAQVLGVLSWAKEAMADDDFATEQIYQASLVLRRIDRLMHAYGHAGSAAAWSAVLPRLMRNARVGLFGEPLNGLQVMGLLEARALDHERVIILGASEGHLPASTADRSYIPYELRRAYELPVRESADAVQAYNFLRMMQRAKDAMLMHADDGASAGPSRYIAQLRHELFRERPNDMTEERALIPVPVHHPAPIAVVMGERTRQLLMQRLATGFTPSMLRTWLQCPLDFWIRNVLKVVDLDDATGPRIPPDLLGSALHKVLEQSYAPWTGRSLKSSELRASRADLPQAIRDALNASQPDVPLDRGEPMLQLSMATDAAMAFMEGEARAIDAGEQIQLVGLEMELSASLPVASLHLSGPVLIRGRVDRVDIRDGVLTILDVKTGRVDENDLRLKNIALEDLQKNKGHAAQLLMYAWLYMTCHPEVMAVRSGLLPLQRTSGGGGAYLKVADDDVILREHLPQITSLLQEVVAQLVHPDTRFEHEPRSKYCALCAEAGQ